MLGKMFSREEAGSARCSPGRKQARQDVLQGGGRLGKTLSNEEDVQEGGSKFRKAFSNGEAGSGRRSGRREQVWFRKTFSTKEAGSGGRFRRRKQVWFRQTFSKKEEGLGLGRRSLRKKQV